MSDNARVPCDQVIARLWEYIDGELRGEGSQEVQAHLDRCSRCFPEYDFRCAYRTFLQRVAQQQVPPEVRLRIFRMILEEGRRPAGAGPGRCDS